MDAKTIFLTLDVDMADYLNTASGVNEMETAVPLIIQTCKELNIVATWFFRIDNRMGLEYGNNDYLFTQYATIISDLKQAGHEVAWHFHSYIKSGKNWKQNENEELVAIELKQNWELANKHALNALRMGWAYHTQKTIETMDTFGLMYDSSALPRPNYAWEKSLRNWENTTNKPYFPSKYDYKIAGDTHINTLQIPITTVPLSVPSDTIPTMLRYINPTYYSHFFNNAILASKEEKTMLIMHPYEVLKNDKSHALMSFSLEIFKANLTWLNKQNTTFKTLNKY